MTSLLNEPDVSFHFHQPSIRDSQHRGLSSLDSDFFSDPSNLISLIVNGSDNHGISSARRHERQRVYSHLTPEELLNMLIDKEYEAKRLSKILRAAVLRLNSQSARISELERDGQEALDRLRQINQSRIEAQQDASRANQELDLYHSQLENARQELTRAEETLRLLRQQREEAEEAASRARGKARKLRQQRLVDAAKAEGRRWGFQDGFERAKESFAENPDVLNGLPTAAPLYGSHILRAEEPAAEEMDDDANSARSSTPEIIQPTEVRAPSTHRESTIQDPFNGPPIRPSRPPAFHPTQPLRPLLRLTPEDLRPPPQPAPVTEPDSSNRPVDEGAQTPDISVFHVDLSDAPREPEPTHHDQRQQRNASREQWVTAQQHQEFDAPLEAQNQARYGPLHHQAGSSRSQAPRGPPLAPRDEKKKFSWYRSFSFRNKFGKRRVLDPEPGKEALASGIGEATANPEEDDLYDHTRPPPISWYHPRGTSLGTRGSRPRTNSMGSGSTHISQLQLIKTPTPLLSRDINASNGSLSLGSGKEASMIRKLKEKESLLSVINEDPMSREHTPITDRFAADRFRVPNIRHFASSSSTVNSQLARGPIDLSNSDSRYPPLSGTNNSSGRHRRAMSEATPPVTIDIQTPSNSRTSSDKPRYHDELPNRFLSPSLASQPLPRSSSADRSRTDNEIPNPRARPRTPSHHTPAMDIRESYLARTATAESTLATQESHDMARSSSRQSARPNPAVSSPMGKDPDLPAFGSPNLNGQALPRVPSTGSIRSLGSYSRFDPTTYVDPAFFEPNAELRGDVPTRPASRNSALSYINENR